MATTTELRTLLQAEVGDVSPDSSTNARYLSLLNKAHISIVGGGGELNTDDLGAPIKRPFIFPWAVETHPKIITLLPPQDGTLDATQNSASVTNCSINSATTNMTGYHIRIGDQSTVYRITLHSGTAITLDGPFIGSTDTSLQFKAFKLIYEIGSNDILMPVDKLRGFSNQQQKDYYVDMVEPSALFDRYPLSKVNQNQPVMAAVLKQENGNLTLQFSHYPSNYQRLEMRFIAIPSDLDLVGSNPIIPNYEEIIVHLAAFYQFRKRDDDRASSHYQTAKQLFDALTTEARQIYNANDEDYGKIKPWRVYDKDYLIET